MKVVKKCDGMSEHNVLDESTDYYLCGERQGMHPYLLAKKDYEPVEEWKDVTRECSLLLVGETYRVYHKDMWIGDRTQYRVTNVNNLAAVKVEVKR